jgi:hypothetical protein
VGNGTTTAGTHGVTAWSRDTAPGGSSRGSGRAAGTRAPRCRAASPAPRCAARRCRAIPRHPAATTPVASRLPPFGQRRNSLTPPGLVHPSPLTPADALEASQRFPRFTGAVDSPAASPSGSGRGMSQAVGAARPACVPTPRKRI